MHQCLVAAATLSLSIIPKSAMSNPAVLAPTALCAGTAGVGCVVVGVTLNETNMTARKCQQSNSLPGHLVMHATEPKRTHWETEKLVKCCKSWKET